jgi:hypothetical protein
LDDIFAVLEAAPSRDETARARECRAALRAAYGGKRTLELVRLALRDVVWAATVKRPKMHVLLHGKVPLRPRAPSSDQ